MPLIIPPDDCCNDDCSVAAHAATGWCLEGDGTPVVVVTTRECVGGVPGAVTVTLIDPSTGAVVPAQGVVQCSGGASITVPNSTVFDCDDSPSVVPALPVVVRGRIDAALCDDQTIQVVQGALTALGHQKLTVGAVAVGLTVPVGARIALIENAPFGSVGTVRWRDSGGAPVGGGVSGVGHYMLAGVSIEYAADLASISFIRDGAQNGSLEISYYS